MKVNSSDTHPVPGLEMCYYYFHSISYFMSPSAYMECHLIFSSLTVGFYLTYFSDNKTCVSTVHTILAVDVLPSTMASAFKYEAVVSILFFTVGKLCLLCHVGSGG